MHQALIDAVRAGLNSKGMDGNSMYPFQITDTAPDDEINNTCRKEGAVCIGTHICELSLGRAGMSQADAIAIALYQGADFEAYQRKSGLWGVQRVKINGKPDYGTTTVRPLSVKINGKRSQMDNGIPQGSPVPY